MRIRGLDEETEELSSDLENISGDIYDLTKVNGTGVSIFTDKTRTEYKSTYEILKEISAIWDELTDKKQAELLEKLGGKRGAQSLAGILADFSSVEEAMKTMQDAAGSADEEMGVIRDSIDYKLNELKQTWISILQDVINREGFKNIIDFLTSFSEGIGNVVDKLGLLRTAATGLGAVIGAIKGYKNVFNIIPNLGNSIKNFFNANPDIYNKSNLDFLDVIQNMSNSQQLLSSGDIDKIAKSIGNVSESAKQYGKQWINNNNILKEGQKLSEGYCEKFSSGLQQLGKSVVGITKSLIGSIVGGVIGSLVGLISSSIASGIADVAKLLWNNIVTDNAEKKRIDEAVKSVQDLVIANKEEVKSVEESIKKYTELNEKLKDTKLSTKDVLEIRKEMLNVQDDLVDKYEAEFYGIDLVNGKYEEQLELLNKIKKTKADEFLYGEGGAMKWDNGKTNFQRNLEVVNEKVGQYAIPLGQFGTWDNQTFEDIYGYSIDEIIKKYTGLKLDKVSTEDGFGNTSYNLMFKIDENLTKEEATKQLNDFYKELLRQYPNNQYAQEFAAEIANIDIGFDKEKYDEALENVQYTIEQILISESNNGESVLNKLEVAVKNYNAALAQYEKSQTSESKKLLDEADTNLRQIQSEAEAIYKDTTSHEYAVLSNTEGAVDKYKQMVDDIIDDKNGGVTSRLEKAFGGFKGKLDDLSEEEKLAIEVMLDDNADVLLEKDLDKLIKEAKEYVKNKPIEVETVIHSDDAVNSMESAKSAIASVGDLWEQTVKNTLALKKDKKYLSEDGNVSKELDTQSLASGFADPTLINSVEDAFKKFIDEDSKEEKTKSLNLALVEFEDTLVKVPNDADAAQKSINKLITAYIDQTDIIENLTEENKEWSIEQLKAYGITNAQAVVESRLNKENKELLKNTKLLAKAFVNNRDSLVDSKKGTEEYLSSIEEIKTQLSSMFATVDENGNEIPLNINTDFVVQNLDLIREAASGDADAINNLRQAVATDIVLKTHISGDPNKVNGIIKEVNSLIDNAHIEDIEVGTYVDTLPFTHGINVMIDGLNSLVKAGMFTRDEMNALLSEIGVSPEIEYEYVDIGTVATADIIGAVQRGDTPINGKVKIPKIKYKVTSNITGAEYSKPSNLSESNPGGSHSSGDNNKLNEDAKETFDWIEKKIQRLDEAIARLDKTVSNTYETWGKRNKALGKELDKVAEEMKVHEHAYKRYLENAKKLTVKDVNVAPNEEDSSSKKQYEYDKKQWDEAVKQWKTGKYQKLVQEGKIGQNDIEQIQNKYLVETIKQYEELYQKAVQAGDAIQDDQIKLGDLNKTRFDNIKSEFDSILQGFEHVSSLIDERISRSEEHGYFVNQDYYKKQLKLEKDANDRNIQQYNALVKARDKAVDSGAIKLGSQAYVEMTADIHKVREEIEASATAQLQLNNNIRQLKWDVFDYALDRLNLIIDEAEFLIDLLDQHELTDDNGYFNERGWASAGLIATEYDVYMQKSKEYAKELTDIEKQLAEEKEKNGVVDQKLIERREELLKLQQDSIKAAEQEKEAIKDLVQNAINKHLEALSKLIERYETSLSDAKSLFDYQKNISQQTENITSLQKQLQAYAGDDSEEARATIQKLQKSLKDAEQGLKETEWDKYISETGELLDKMYEDYSETLNDRLDNIDTLMEDMIGWINQKGDLINTTINDVSEQYGYEVSKETQSILSSNGDIVSSFNMDFNNKMAETLDVAKEIKDGIYAMAYGKEAKNIVDSEGTGKISNGKWHKTKDGRWWYENIDGSYAYNETITIDGKKYSFDKDGYLKGYATGSSNIPSNQLAWTQENGSEFIFRKSDGAMLTPLNRGDMIFTKDMSENLWNMAKNPALTGMNVNLPTGSIARTVNQDNDITIVLPNVQSYDEFKSALQKDPKFTNFIQATTLGQSLGKGKLNRGNF